MTYAGLSLWHSTVGGLDSGRERLERDITVDVCIVGAGYTGLWTAYYLATARPDLKIAVVEREIAGFGASGRNGGWASALFPSSLATLAKRSDRSSALAQHEAMRASIDEIIRVSGAEGIQADIAKGGTIVLARTQPQAARAAAEVADARSWGRDWDDVRLLDGHEARNILNAAGTIGATYTPDCAVIHPAKLVRGLAEAVERRGVQIFEQSPATTIEPHRVTTPGGTIRTDFVVRATEGYSSQLNGYQRGSIPVYSLMIATAPLSESLWNEIGLANRETFSDHRNLIVYGQRTADNRMVFGGRGAPYHFGSTVDGAYDRDERVFAALYSALTEMFPMLRGTKISHSWGGPLGITRDWSASVGLDEESGIGWAGGYVGDGVTTTNLAGRTLRDLILGDETELTELPWVNHHSPRWEPEPLRWAGVNAGLRAMTWADTEEHLTGRSSLTAKLMAPFLGGH